MADTTSSEAPFPIEHVREMTPNEALGWACRQSCTTVYSRDPHRDSTRPLTVVFTWRAEGNTDFGEFGHDATDEDCYRVAEHVHRTLWPKPAPKPIREMTEDELFAVVKSIDKYDDLHVYRLLNGSGVHPFLAFVAFEQRAWGSEKVEAMRGAVRNAAQHRGRYDSDTDTITEATDD